MRHGLLHYPRRLDHLRQEHLARSEQVPDQVHALHQWAFDDLDRAREQQPRFLGIGDDVGVDPFDQSVREPLLDRPAAPFSGLLLGNLVGAAIFLGQPDQYLGRIAPGFGRAIEDDVLDRFAEHRVDRVVDVQLPGVDDRHVEPGGDGVEQEHAVHRAPHRLVAAERETEIAQPARDVDARTARADLDACLDKVERIALMLVDSGRDREDIGVEDDVLGREAVGSEQLVRPLANLDLALAGVGLAGLVERHHHHRRAVSANFPRGIEERPLAFLHADRIDDRLARCAFQPGLDDRPFRAVDHQRDARDVGFGGDPLDVGGHRQLAVEQGLVHIDVEDLRARLDLRARDLDRGLIVSRQDQLLELGRAGDVAAFADIDEARAGPGAAGLTHAAMTIGSIPASIV